VTSSIDSIRAAIESRIAAEMAIEPAYPVAYQNVPFVPPNNATWLQASVLLGDSAYATLLSPGIGMNRQNGVVTIDVYTPIGNGSGPNLEIAQRMKSLFDRQTVNDILFDAASGPAQVPQAAPAAYFQTQLTVSFEAYLD